MSNKSSILYWPRAERPERRTAAFPAKPSSAETQHKLRALARGLLYVGLFWLVLFLEVYVRTETKSMSLEVWTLSRRKAEIESELTRLDMRLTVLESPLRLQELASSEIGLTVVTPQQKPQTNKTQHNPHH